MKTFPDKVIDGNLILDPLKKSLKQLYTLKRTKVKSATYDGYDYDSSSIKANCPSPDYDLTAKSLAYHAERDRQPIDVILQIAFRLGFCQGMVFHKEISHIDYLKARSQADRETISELLQEIKKLKEVK